MFNKKNKFSTLAFTSLAILTMAACQKQETNSASQPASTTSVVKQTTPSSTASSSQKADTTKTSTSAKKTVASSSKTPSASSATKAASTVTTEQVAPAQSVDAVNQVEVVQSATPDNQSAVVQAPAETNVAQGVVSVEQSSPNSSVSGDSQDDIEAFVKQKIEEIPALVAQVSDSNNPGIGVGAYTDDYAAELEKQGYWEKLDKAFEEAGVTNPWEG